MASEFQAKIEYLIKMATFMGQVIALMDSINAQMVPVAPVKPVSEYNGKRRGPKPNKRSFGISSRSPRRTDAASEAKILKMRQELSVAKSLDKLTENQIAALDQTKGVFVRKMTEAQKAQIVSIYEDVKGI